MMKTHMHAHMHAHANTIPAIAPPVNILIKNELVIIKNEFRKN